MVQSGAIWGFFFFSFWHHFFVPIFFKEEGEIATCAIYKIIRNTLHTHPSFGNGFGLPLRSSPFPFLHTLACDCLGCLTLQNYSLSGKVNWREFTAKHVRPDTSLARLETTRSILQRAANDVICVRRSIAGPGEPIVTRRGTRSNWHVLHAFKKLHQKGLQPFSFSRRIC
jgi:hypothetical protein